MRNDPRLTAPRLSRRLTGPVLLVVAALVLSGCGLSLQSLPKPGVNTRSTYAVHATFADVLNLPVDAQVRDGSRIVGVVGDMTERDYLAEVELRIKDSYRVPRGTTAEVRFDNPLGDQYIELHKPKVTTEGYLPPGGRLALAETAAAPTVEDTLGAIATVLNGGGVGNLQSISHELNEMFDGNQPQIRDLIGKLDVAATKLAGGIGDIDAAMTALDALAKELNTGDDVLPRGITSLSEAIGVLAGQNEQFDQLLAGLDEFGSAGNQAIAASGKQTVKAIKKLLPVVNQIVEADAQITPALRNLRALQAQVPTVTSGGYAQLSVRLPVVVSSAPSGVSGSTRLVSPRPPVSSLMTGLGPLTKAGAESAHSTERSAR